MATSSKETGEESAEAAEVSLLGNRDNGTRVKFHSCVESGFQLLGGDTHVHKKVTTESGFQVGEADVEAEVVLTGDVEVAAADEVEAEVCKIS